MNSLAIKDKKEKWVDIYKGILIIIMVLGHITGRYNVYIYQFHVPAFFFISGYLLTFEKEGIGIIIWKRIYSLIIPFLFSFLLVNILEEILSLFKIQITSNFDFGNRIKQLFLYGFPGGVLGPCWFIFALLGSIIVSKMLYSVWRGTITYIGASFLVFLAGCFWAGKVKENSLQIPYYMDICLITQFYVSLGKFYKDSQIRIWKDNSKKIFIILILGINILLFYYFGKINVQLIDIANRSLIGNVFGSILATTNGIIFLIIISGLLGRLFSKERILSFIGKNTLGILIYHMLFFKLTDLVFIFFDMFDMKNFIDAVPPKELGYHYWWLYLIMAICGSMVFWMVLQKLPITSIITGSKKDKWNQIYMKKIRNLSFVHKIRNFENRITMLVNEWKSKSGQIHSNDKMIWILWYIAIIIPMIIQGIICNDELQTRLYSKVFSFREFIKYNVYEEVIIKGKALGSIFVALERYLEFISDNIYVSRFVCVLVITLEVAAFSKLIFTVFHNKGMAIFAAIFTLTCMPVTFELTSPNTFVIVFGIPLTLLLLSFSYWINYLDHGEKKNLVMFGLFFFFSMFHYEVLVTYTPIFILIWIAKCTTIYKTIQDWGKGFVKKGIIPVYIAVVYFVLYIACCKVWPSQYEGNQLELTMMGVLSNMRQLVISGCPGYFLFNKKYQGLAKLYFARFNGSLLGYFRAFSCVCLSLMAMNKVFCKFTVTERVQKKDIFYLMTGFLCCVLPTLPNSISKMYQGLINENAFISLPVSHFVYFAACFISIFLLWKIWSMFPPIGKSFILVGMFFLFWGIQLMNTVFSTQSYYNYKDLEYTEKVFETESIKSLNHSSIGAGDIFVSRDGLGIHDTYWTMVARNNGLDIRVEHSYNEQPYYLYRHDDMFYLGDGSIQVMLSKTNLDGKKVLIKCGNLPKYEEIVLNNGVKDNAFYVYYFNLSDEMATLISLNGADRFIGTTKAFIGANEYLYGDWWVVSNGGFKIRTAENGGLHIRGYRSKKATEDNWMTVLINGEEQMTISLDSSDISLDLKTDADEIIEVTFISDIDEQLSDIDVRKAIFLLSDVYTD